MKVLLVENDNGKYQNKKGKKYNLITCTWVKGPRANEFLDFPTLQEALKNYGLTEAANEEHKY